MGTVRIGYLDSSVLLRNVLEESGSRIDLGRYDTLLSSRLIRIESFRVVHRLFTAGMIDAELTSRIHLRLRSAFEGVSLIEMSEHILAQSEGTYPLPVGSLDAIHLASAVALRNLRAYGGIEILTHDSQLGRCAQALGFSVVGL